MQYCSFMAFQDHLCQNCFSKSNSSFALIKNIFRFASKPIVDDSHTLLPVDFAPPPVFFPQSTAHLPSSKFSGVLTTPSNNGMYFALA